MRTRTRTILAGLVLAAALVGGAAWATIPDGNGLYTACKLNATGTIRLIDPSGTSTSLLSRCTSYETKITWNQKGQKGEPGAAGANGTNGADGATGSNGTDGAPGTKGDPCLATDPACIGPKGDTGTAGTNGTNGTDGASGAKGDPCLATDPACVGPKGDPGAAGTNGANGTNGAPGAKGDPCLATDPACIGPKGDPGAKGDPGTIGTITHVTASADVPPSNYGTIFALCPSTHPRVVSGGFSISSQYIGMDPSVRESRPLVGGGGWIVRLLNNNTNGITTVLTTAHATCMA